MRNIKSCVNCLRRWQLCRLVGKIHKDDICSGLWRRRFTRRFLVNQEKKRTLYQRSCMHEDAEDKAHVQIWILPLTSWVKSFSLFWSLNILIWKRQLYYFRATHKLMPRLRYPLFLKSVWKWWGWEWLWYRLDGCSTGCPSGGGDGTMPVTTVKVWGWEDHSRYRRQTFQQWCQEVNLFPFLNSSAWKVSVELSPQPDL